MNRISKLLMVAALLSSPALHAQLENADNLHVDSTGGWVYYEQRLYRNPLVGIMELKTALPKQPAREYIPLVQGIPVGGYRTDGDGLSFRALSRDERRAYHAQHRINPLTYRFDFRIHPEFVAIFGNFRNPVESRTSVLLQSQLYLWRGMVLNYGVLFPIVNDLDRRPDIIRPAPTFLNQFLALDGHNFISASAGFFHTDRYGLNVQYQHANLTAAWSYGLEAGLTGFYYFPRGGIYYEGLNELLVLGNIAYRWRAHDLTIKASGGQFLADDRGVRMDMIRQFTNVEIALYATKTKNGATLGFNFAVPIPPGKIVQGPRARLRTSEEFRWEYTYTRGYNIGERYRLGYQLDERLRQYHRGYLSNQMRRFTKD